MPSVLDPGAANNGVNSYLNFGAYGIRDVWANNMEDEFKIIRQIVQRYTYVAMDTEFPGTVAEPTGTFPDMASYKYQFLICNVNILKIIQLALTFMDENGVTPPGITTWQFNFNFNLNKDTHAENSIDLLKNSGIQFNKHGDEGINPTHFAELLMTSGVVLQDNIQWLAFHGGYDFGYLLKMLRAEDLPAEELEFFELLRIYFPKIYDVKYLMRSCKDLKGGLQEVSACLGVERIGLQHQAGSDSLLTGATFFKLREMYFEDNIDDFKYCGILDGLGSSYSINGYSVMEAPYISTTSFS